MSNPLCNGARHPATSDCAGPPATFTEGHDEVDEAPAIHIGACTHCFATMLGCWRNHCDLAGGPIAEFFVMLVGRRIRGLAARLRNADQEEARQAIVLVLVRKARRNDSWDPHHVETLENISSWVSHAATNAYFDWYKTNIKRPEDLVLDSDEHGTGTRHLLEDANTAITHDHLESRDPANIAMQTLGNEIISPEEKQRVDDALQLLRRAINSRKTDQQVAFFAGWMHYCANIGDRIPSSAEYSERVGVNRVTGWRDINRVHAALEKVLTSDEQLEELTRQRALNILHRVASMADLQHETTPA